MTDDEGGGDDYGSRVFNKTQWVNHFERPVVDLWGAFEIIYPHA